MAEKLEKKKHVCSIFGPYQGKLYELMDEKRLRGGTPKMTDTVWDPDLPKINVLMHPLVKGPPS